MTSPELCTKTLVPLKELGQHLPPPAPSYTTLARWIRQGVNGRRLRCYRAGRRPLVDLADLREFLRETAVPDEPPPSPAPRRRVKRPFVAEREAAAVERIRRAK